MKDETYAKIHEIAHLLGLQTTALNAANLSDLDDTKLREFMARERDIQSSIDALHSRPTEEVAIVLCERRSLLYRLRVVEQLGGSPCRPAAADATIHP